MKFSFATETDSLDTQRHRQTQSVTAILKLICWYFQKFLFVDWKFGDICNYLAVIFDFDNDLFKMEQILRANSRPKGKKLRETKTKMENLRKKRKMCRLSFVLI